MIRYNTTKQLSIEEFYLPFEGVLDKENRWVQLALLIPWDELADIYYKAMNVKKGAPTKDARVVIGSVVIKHKMKLDDRGAIEMIKENPYMQYFLGLSGFTQKPVFDPSLFVSIRKRLGADAFDLMNQQIIERAELATNKKIKVKNEDKSDKQDDSDIMTTPKNRGRLQMDATVADADIKYPTDLGLLNDSREKSEELIDLLCGRLEISKKPRTYRKVARKKYLNISKKKSKKKNEIKRGIREQLQYLKRNISHLNTLLDYREELPLKKQEQKYFFVIQHVYAQQEEMYREKKHSVPNRIVSIHQPHVRPIVRGKAGSDVEFGAKIGVDLQNGYTRIGTISWEAYNENTDLKKQVENYKELHGYYPELVQVDRIYLTQTNRGWLKERNIRYTGKPLGRPPKQILSTYQKQKARKESAERNWIEGKFGQGKNGYCLNNIRAKLQKTSESWIAAIFFMMNLIKFSKECFLFSWLILRFVPKDLYYKQNLCEVCSLNYKFTV